MQLDHDLSCGDGVVDVLAGEECDPGNDTNSPHLTACLDKNLGGGKDGEGMAGCSEECTIEASKNVCAFCGDGIAAGDEQCDGSDLRGEACKSGKGTLSCKPPGAEGGGCVFNVVNCDPCGDGAFSSEVEECDFSSDCAQGEACDMVACNTILGPDNNPYVSGEVEHSDCTTECRYDRRKCDYCGDGYVNPAYPDFSLDNPGFIQTAEVCDNAKLNPDGEPDAEPGALAEYCDEICTNGGGSTLELRCKFKCHDDCLGFDEQAWENPEAAGCCVRGGEPCDVEDGFPCCWELDYPEANPADACKPTIEGQNLVFKCNTKPPDEDGGGDETG